MSARLLLRIAAVCMLLHTIGHTFGALSWKEAPTPSVGQTITAMQTNHFTFMERQCTIASFYEGYGVTLIFVLLLVTALLWLLSNHHQNVLGEGILTLIVVFLMTLALLEYIYFFPLAAILTALCAVFALSARIRMNAISKN